MVVGGFPRFQRSGYWFRLVDPWPAYWSNNWYEGDDVYVVYPNNGYHMFDQTIPWRWHRNQRFDVKALSSAGQERPALQGMTRRRGLRKEALVELLPSEKSRACANCT